MKQTIKRLESVLKGADRALDNFRDLSRAVALGFGDYVHDGWVHPHPAGLGRHCSCHQARSRAKSCLNMEART